MKRNIRPDVKAISARCKTTRPIANSIPSSKLELLKGKSYAANTGKKYNWACKAYKKWRESALDDNTCDNLEDIALSDLTKPQTLDKQKLCNSLCKFIVKIRKGKGGDYPPQTVHALMIAIQMYLKHAE